MAVQVATLDILTERAHFEPDVARAIGDAITMEISHSQDVLATKHDLSELRTGIRQEMADFRSEIRQEMADFRAEIKEEMADFRAEIKEEMADFRAEIKEEMADFRAEIKQEMADFRSEIEQRLGEHRAEFRSELTQLRSFFEVRFANQDTKISEFGSRLERTHRQMVLWVLSAGAGYMSLTLGIMYFILQNTR